MQKPQPDLGERLVSGVLGALFGAIIGFILAWLFGVYSNRMGAGTVPLGIRQWILGSAGIFGLLGLLLGSDVGTVAGSVFNGIYESERDDDMELPMWVWCIVAVVAAYFVWRWWTHA